MLPYILCVDEIEWKTLFQMRKFSSVVIGDVSEELQ
jgi:hypothetical protein